MVFRIFGKKRKREKEEKEKELPKAKKEKREEKELKRVEKGEKREKEERKEEKKQKASKEKGKEGLPIEFSDVLVSPHISEKASFLEKENKYIFRVRKKANKIQIKKAIQYLYGVHVESIRIINIPPKKRRLGRVEGMRKGYKKAIVKIREGEKIQILTK